MLLYTHGIYAWYTYYTMLEAVVRRSSKPRQPNRRGSHQLQPALPRSHRLSSSLILWVGTTHSRKVKENTHWRKVKPNQPACHRHSAVRVIVAVVWVCMGAWRGQHSYVGPIWFFALTFWLVGVEPRQIGANLAEADCTIAKSIFTLF